MRLVAALTGFMLVATGCSSGTIRVVESPGLAPASRSPSTPRATTTGTSTNPTASPAPSPSGSASPDTRRVHPGPGPRNTMVLKVTLNRSCAKRGDEMVSEAVTEAGAQITFAAGYVSSNDLPPDFEYVPKEGNVTGTHTWRWVIRPDIRPGDAVLSVVASKGNKGASYNIPFRVATAC